jgi:hypothetical protein
MSQRTVKLNRQQELLVERITVLPMAILPGPRPAAHAHSADFHWREDFAYPQDAKSS